MDAFFITMDLKIKDKIKRLNPLTAKIAKVLRKDRKELNYRTLTLCTLRLLSALCG
jgi:hypothetical protein